MSSKKQQALKLYSETDLTKTQIAASLGLHRNTLSTWVRQGSWDRLKAAGQHLPAILAENCYHIMGHLTEHYLSEFRATRPITHKEADTLHKLACTINKLRSRTNINENMQVLGYFLDGVRQKSKRLAAELKPLIEEHLSGLAKISVASLMPDDLTAPGGRIPAETPEQEQERHREVVADAREAHFSDPETIAVYKEHNIPLPSDMLPETTPKRKKLPRPQNTTQENDQPTSPLGRPGGVNIQSTQHNTSSPSGRSGGAAHTSPVNSNEQVQPTKQLPALAKEGMQEKGAEGALSGCGGSACGHAQFLHSKCTPHAQ